MPTEQVDVVNKKTTDKVTKRTTPVGFKVPSLLLGEGVDSMFLIFFFFGQIKWTFLVDYIS